MQGSHLTLRSHLSGNYIKFIDDFRSAIYGWNSVYGTLTCELCLPSSQISVLADAYTRLAKPQGYPSHVV